MNSPNPFQKKMFWAALTALSFVAVGGVLALVGSLIIRGISFLQPILLPLAVAGILAYLLEPIVRRFERRRLSRLQAVIVVFLVLVTLITGIILWVAPPLYRQGQTFVTGLPGYTERAHQLLIRTVDKTQRLADLPIFRPPHEGESRDAMTGFLAARVEEGTKWIEGQIPMVIAATGRFLGRSAGGFLGAFGTLLSLVLVPIFLFFFLKEGPGISKNWSLYLPLRASPFKSEVVSLLSEINSYLINFFRGQLLVSLIDGAITAVALTLVGLDFAVLIGLLVGVLGMIPYAGVFISWIPAVIIAAAQFGDWFHPLLVTGIFLLVNNLDGIVIAPKIVGDSVGLHPLTVIVSVIAWSIVLGGLLGALLAVPLTATLKVVLKRYFWDIPAPEEAPGG